MNENLETMELVPYEEENEEIMETNENSGMGTGLAMILGGGLTLVAIAGGKKLKKLWDKRKAQKENSNVIVVDPVSTNEDSNDSEENTNEES